MVMMLITTACRGAYNRTGTIYQWAGPDEQEKDRTAAQPDSRFARGRVRVTLEEIRENVCGYKQDDTNSFKRMFERDKRELRDMGIPIEVESTDPFGEEQGFASPRTLTTCRR